MLWVRLLNLVISWYVIYCPQRFTPQVHANLYITSFNSLYLYYLHPWASDSKYHLPRSMCSN